MLAAQQATLNNSYADVLPAFNAALEFTPNLVLRANWAKNLARPKPTDLVPNINCLDDATVASADDVCTAGNPDLKPYRADQWELNLAWYPNKDTLVSLGYYKKYESSFVVPNVTRSGVDLFHDGITYTVRQPVNGFGALLDGVEASAQTVFSFLPKPFDGFGVSGNLTYARAIRTNLTNSATGAPLNEYPGLSTWTWNASVFYDKGWLNVRMNYNYRSDWLVTIADSNNGNFPIYRRAEGYLDGKITLRFPKWHFSVFAEMQHQQGIFQVLHQGHRDFGSLIPGSVSSPACRPSSDAKGSRFPPPRPAVQRAAGRLLGPGSNKPLTISRPEERDMRSCNDHGETTLTRRTLNLGLVAGALLPFPAQASHLFDVRAFGAKGDGRAIDSGAFNAAIAAAARASGGIVLVPAGRYLCFSIELKSRVTIQLAKGAVIEAADPARHQGSTIRRRITTNSIRISGIAIGGTA